MHSNGYHYARSSIIKANKKFISYPGTRANGGVWLRRAVHGGGGGIVADEAQ